MENQTIGIIGCGWLGKKLLLQIGEDQKIFLTTSNEETTKELSKVGYSSTAIHFSDSEANIAKPWKHLSNLDSIVMLIPLSLRRSSKEALTFKIQNIVAFMGDFKGQLVLASSTGVYPSDPKLYKEEDLSPETILTESLIKERFPQTNILRFAGLMGGDRLLSKYKVTKTDDPVNHIHYRDASSAIQRVIEEQISGETYNIVAPMYPSKKEVIESQEDGILTPYKEATGRKIASAKLIAELDFKFKFPDPRTFHLTP
ncbi:MAG: hypothetical protein HRT61_08330 [Ekhidna sp.]|nr:hypothetical protein [Ekhidna sp.]